jgi:DNA (cytosine-5)-methyltransferase 1
LFVQSCADAHAFAAPFSFRAQVRFGVLNAAFYGVGQSRKRAFLLAAAPGEQMPEWPLPMTCFNSPQLTFNLPGGVDFCAVPQRKTAPLRAVTVRDMIGDLPAVRNGCDDDDASYDKAPESAYQHDIRLGATRLRNHICKVLNEVNVQRCSLIPRESNHDWRYLRILVESGKVEALFKTPTMSKPAPLVPLCLPNSEARHNGWRGLYSRLDWGGHFPTSTTDPNPMGKVGQVFHPAQDRIVSVRECARSQGFPDTFTFYGAVSAKHRQVGNAVPPPLAAALGRELRKALETKAAQGGDAMEE